MRRQLTSYFMIILVQIIGLSGVYGLEAAVEQQIDHDLNSPAFQKRMTTAAFEILEHWLTVNDGAVYYPSDLDELKSPLFVTWEKDGQLAGCIGTFDQNEKLGINIAKMAVAAATQDDRFKPLTKEDIPRLKVEINLLSNFEKIQDPMDWEVGKHGITIHFNEVKNDGRDMGATYLPHVASGAGWNQLQTLDSLVQKAGHHGNYVDV